MNFDDFKRNCETAVKLEQENLERMDQSVLKDVLYSAFRIDNLEAAVKVFQVIRRPNVRNVTQYVTLLGKHIMSSRAEIARSELIRIWRIVVLYGYEGDSRLITCLFKALSFSKSEQRRLINQLISKPASPSIDCGVLASFLKFCKNHNTDMDFTRNVWEWGERIRKEEFGSHFYFSTCFQYYSIFGASVSELKALWNQVTECRQDQSPELVFSHYSALSIDLNEQKLFISTMISKPPIPTYDCDMVFMFLRHCSETRDKELAMKVWHWGEVLRNREYGSLTYFSASFQYLSLFGAGMKELPNLWKQIAECDLREKYELTSAMCSALSSDPEKQKQYISQVISKPPCPTFSCGLLGAFLLPCENNLPLAQSIWSWGSSIREREQAREDLCNVVIQYLGICSKLGDLELLDSVWKDAEDLKVDGMLNVKSAYLSAIISQRATEHAIKFVEKFGSESLNTQSFIMLLKLFSDAGESDKALEFLRLFQKQHPSALSIISQTSVVSGLCETGNFDAALLLLEEAKSHGHNISTETWRTILNLCKKHKNLPIALRAFEEINGIETDPGQLAIDYRMVTNVHSASGEEEK